MMGNLGLGEILTIVVVVLLLFGARRIPEVARGIGRGLRDFKAALIGESLAEVAKPSDPCCPACVETATPTEPAAAKAEALPQKTGGA